MNDFTGLEELATALASGDTERRRAAKMLLYPLLYGGSPSTLRPAPEPALQWLPRTAEYTGHSENTGGLQRHSIGDLYPMVIEYYPQAGEYGILDSRDGRRYCWRHASYDATAGECRRLLEAMK